MQRCSRTHHGRIVRHNKICKVLEVDLKRKGWRVQSEPHIRVPTTGHSYEVVVPDLVCIKDNTLIMVDPQIVASSRLDVSYKLKQHKYTREGIKEAVRLRYGANLHIECLPVTITWKGIFHHRSEERLRSMDIKVDTLNRLGRYAIFGSYLNFSSFMCSV